VEGTRVLFSLVSLVSLSLSREQTNRQQVRMTDKHLCKGSIQLQYGKTFYYTCGSPHHELVVCLHGFGLFSDMWTRVAHEIASKQYYVLCFDFYGMGFTDSPEGVNYDVELLRDQTWELLEELGLGSRSLRLIGFSQGGAVASAFAKHYANRISSLFLIAPVGISPYTFFWQRPIRICGGWMADIVSHKRLGVLRRTAQVASRLITKLCRIDAPPSEEAHLLLGNRTGPISQRLKQTYLISKSELYFYGQSYRSLLGRLKTLRDFPLICVDLSETIYKSVGELMETVGFNTTVIWGTDDRMLRYHPHLPSHIKKFMPKADIVVLDETGHCLVAEKHHHFLELVFTAFSNSPITPTVNNTLITGLDDDTNCSDSLVSNDDLTASDEVVCGFDQCTTLISSSSSSSSPPAGDHLGKNVSIRIESEDNVEATSKMQMVKKKSLLVKAITLPYTAMFFPIKMANQIVCDLLNELRVQS